MEPKEEAKNRACNLLYRNFVSAYTHRVQVHDTSNIRALRGAQTRRTYGYGWFRSVATFSTTHGSYGSATVFAFTKYTCRPPLTAHSLNTIQSFNVDEYFFFCCYFFRHSNDAHNFLLFVCVFIFMSTSSISYFFFAARSAPSRFFVFFFLSVALLFCFVHNFGAELYK